MSGAKNCPETTRQKMIGMMYLVLTAMLALNVSTEVLRGFTLMDDSLHETITSSESRNQNLYDDFAAAYSRNPDKVKAYLSKAQEVSAKSDSLFIYIENFKKAMLNQTNIEDSLKVSGRLPETGIDNLDVSHNYAIDKKNGLIFKEHLAGYRHYISDTIFSGNARKKKIYNEIFSTDKTRQRDGTPLSWEASLFSGVPVSAAVALLTKYQNDIRSAETDAIQFLLGQTDRSDFRVNKVQAMVIPVSKNVFTGSEYRAQIVLSAVDSTKKPEYFIGGQKIDNSGLYRAGASSIGTKKYSGYLQIPDNNGNLLKYDFDDEYYVSEPSASILNTDLNVVFLGFEHLFKISVPGVAPENIHLDVSGATYTPTKVAGQYSLKASSMGEVKISVSATVEGKNMAMGSNTFKVKRLPRPSVFLQDKNGNEKEGSMSINDLKGATVIASYGPDALIAANFTVTTFTMNILGLAPKVVTGQTLDLDYLNKLTRGKDLIISNIKAKGPGGEQTLAAIVVKAL
jgi:gliding motility-associated protein GldM